MFFETMLSAARISDMRTSGEWPDQLLDVFLQRGVDSHPDRPLVHDRFGTISWADVAQAVDEISRGLLELGVRPGDVVQVQLPNWRQFPVAVAAIERIGAVVNPVAPIFRANEVTVMSGLARPVAVITAEVFRGFELAAMHAELRDKCPWVRDLIVVGDSSPVAALTWDELLEQGRFSTYDRAAVDLVRPSPDAVCELIFTSGTTGQPKGVLHTPNTLQAATNHFVDAVCRGTVEGPDGHVFHMASTLAHQTGYLYGIRSAITSGGQVVLQDVWDPTEFVALIEQHRIVTSMGATPFLADVLAVEGRADSDLSSFQRFVCAGAPIPQPVLERAEGELPCTVLPAWGMTECAMLTVGNPSDSVERRLTDGAPLPGNEVRVVDQQGEAALATEGDLQARGSFMFVGYLQGRELSQECWTNGWFDTGDRAIHDADGYIKIAGRSKDLVIRGGENIPVKEVEDVLLRHPAVAQVALVAQPDERLGEIACAFIVAEGPAPDLADLTGFLAQHSVTKQFWPEAIRVVEDFPMTPSGKVQKFRLRDQLG